MGERQKNNGHPSEKKVEEEKKEKKEREKEKKKKDLFFLTFHSLLSLSLSLFPLLKP